MSRILLRCVFLLESIVRAGGQYDSIALRMMSRIGTGEQTPDFQKEVESLLKKQFQSYNDKKMEKMMKEIFNKDSSQKEPIALSPNPPQSNN